MDKKIAGLLGAAAALTTVTAAQAAVPSTAGSHPPATSYSDLLDPVPNALPLFKAEAAQSDQTHTNQVAETVIIKKKAHHHHHHHHHDHD